MLRALARDPAGIAYAPLAYRSAGVKALAVGDGPGTYATPSERTVQDRSYPLARPVYMVYTIDDERTQMMLVHPRPLLAEFLRYVLSREGQAEVARDDAFLPLPNGVAGTQRRRLEFQGIPPEMKLLPP